MHRHILFVHTHGGIGDLLLSAPIADAIKRSWPDASISAWVRPAYRTLLDRNPSFANCLSIDGRSFAAQCLALRQGRYDVAILPWTTARQAALAWLGRIPVRVGQAGRAAYSWMFTVPVEIASAHGDTSRHWMDIQLDYARALGFATEGLAPRLYLADGEVEAARALLAAHGIRPEARPCALHVGRGLPLTRERWPLARFIEVGEMLTAVDHQVVVIGSAAEQSLAKAVADAIGPRAVSLAGGTARELAALIGHMAVVITPDSGPGHIAAALDVPVVSIFAVKATPVARWRPWTPAHRVVTPAPWVCPKKCVKETCERFDCLAAIDPSKVVHAVLELTAGRDRI